MIGHIDGATRVLGKAQGYIGLPVLDEQTFDKTNGQTVPSMTTAWFPTPAEIEAINVGDAIYVRIFGNQHPPIMLWAGEAMPHVVQSSDYFTACTLLHNVADRNACSVVPGATLAVVLAQIGALIA